MQRHAGLATGCDAAWMQHLGAGGRDFLRFVVVETDQQSRLRHAARIGAEHAGDIGPDLDPISLQPRAEAAGAGVGTTTTEQAGAALAITNDEALRQQRLALRRETRTPVVIGIQAAAHRQPARPLAEVRRIQRTQPVARVSPANVHALRLQVGHAQCARQQFALRLPFGAPVQVTQCSARIGGQPLQFREAFAQHGIDLQAQLGNEFSVTLLQARQHILRRFGTLAAGLQPIGDVG